VPLPRARDANNSKIVPSGCAGMTEAPGDRSESDSHALILELLLQSRAALLAWNRFGTAVTGLLGDRRLSAPNWTRATAEIANRRLEETFEGLQSFLYAAAIVSTMLFPPGYVSAKYREANELAKTNARRMKRELGVSELSPLGPPGRQLRNELTHLERSVATHIASIPPGSYAPMAVGPTGAEWLAGLQTFRRITGKGRVLSIKVGEADMPDVRPLLRELERLTYGAASMIGLQHQGGAYRVVPKGRKMPIRDRIAEGLKRLTPRRTLRG
jgi:hypothetical protein